jgi:hypothetical protein
MKICTVERFISPKATRGSVPVRGLGVIVTCLLIAAVDGAQAETLPEGLELLASPATSNNPFIFPAATTADASRLLFDWGFSGRAGIMDAGGFELLALPPEGRSTTSGFAISPDGAFVVGTSDRRQPTLPLDQTYAVLWREGVPSVLPDLASPGSSVATDVSADGRIVVGRSRLSPGNISWGNAAVRWVDGVLDVLPLPPGAALASAELVSDDGSTIVGIVQPADARSARLVRWRAGLVEELPPPPSIPFPVPIDLNSDGSVLLVQGTYFGTDAADSPAARFDAGGWTAIEDLPTGRRTPEIGAGSDDGTVVSGAGTIGVDPLACPPHVMCTLFNEAFVWTEATGTRRMKDLLTEGCGYPIDAWTIDRAWISRDARHVVLSASWPDLSAAPPAYVRASIEHCSFQHPPRDEAPAPGSTFASLPRLILHLSPEGDTRVLASNGPIPQGHDLEVGPDRFLYALGVGQLARIGIDDGVSTMVTQGGLMGNSTRGLALDRDGTPYVLSDIRDAMGRTRAHLFRIDPASGTQTLVATYPGNGSQLEREPGGTLAVLVQQSIFSQVFDLHRFDPSNGSSALLSSGTSVQFPGLAVGRDGELFLGFDSDSIQRIDALTGIARRITTGPMRHDPRVRDLDLAGAPLVWDLPRRYLIRVDPDTGETSAGFGSFWFNGNTVGASGGEVAVLRSQCSDGFDNDRSGLLDHPQDPGCASPDDDSELVRTDVRIDIEPSRADNRINLTGQVPVRVAVLGSESAPTSELLIESLAFGPAGARPRESSPHWRDVNRDGFPDAIVSFDSSETGLAPSDTEACLTGELEGDAFRACDAVDVRVPGCGHGHQLAFAAPFLTWFVGRGKRSRRSDGPLASSPPEKA